MDANQVSYIVALLFAIAILVILIVILSTKKGTVALGDNDVVGEINNINDKVNWLYYISIAEVGIIVLFGLLGLLAMRRFSMKA
jgi:hypothetical protein